METLESLSDDVFNAPHIVTCSISTTFYVFLVATTVWKNCDTFFLPEESVFFCEATNP